jgi:hypothetical protein
LSNNSFSSVQKKRFGECTLLILEGIPIFSLPTAGPPSIPVWWISSWISTSGLRWPSQHVDFLGVSPISRHPSGDSQLVCPMQTTRSDFQLRHLAEQHARELPQTGEPLGTTLRLMFVHRLCALPAQRKLQLWQDIA